MKLRAGCCQVFQVAERWASESEPLAPARRSGRWQRAALAWYSPDRSNPRLSTGSTSAVVVAWRIYLSSELARCGLSEIVRCPFVPVTF